LIVLAGAGSSLVRPPEAHRMITVSFGNYEAYCQADGMPSPEVLAEFEQRAALTERLGMEFRGADGFCAVRRRGNEWPFLVVTQPYAPAGESGFHLGLVVVPETHRLFLGAGCRLLAYDLSAPARLRASQPGRTRRCAGPRRPELIHGPTLTRARAAEAGRSADQWGLVRGLALL